MAHSKEASNLKYHYKWTSFSIAVCQSDAFYDCNVRLVFGYVVLHYCKAHSYHFFLSVSNASLFAHFVFTVWRSWRIKLWYLHEQFLTRRLSNGWSPLQSNFSSGSWRRSFVNLPSRLLVGYARRVFVVPVIIIIRVVVVLVKLINHPVWNLNGRQGFLVNIVPPDCRWNEVPS